MTDDGTTPTWGYHATEPAKVFNLKPGEKLPKGWNDRPLKGQHPHDRELGIQPDPIDEKKDGQQAA